MLYKRASEDQEIKCLTEQELLQYPGAERDLNPRFRKPKNGDYQMPGLSNELVNRTSGELGILVELVFSLWCTCSVYENVCG